MLKLRASYGKVGNQVKANPYALYSYTGNYNALAAGDLRGFIILILHGKQLILLT